MEICKFRIHHGRAQGCENKHKSSPLGVAGEERVQHGYLGENAGKAPYVNLGAVTPSAKQQFRRAVP